MAYHFDPVLDKTVYQTATSYMRTLAGIGYALMSVTGGISSRMSIDPQLATGIAGVAFAVAFLFGKKYRQRVDEFLERASRASLMKICSKAWPFWLSMMFFTAVGLGLVQSSQFDLWNQFMSVGGVVGLAVRLLANQFLPQ